MMAFTKPGGMKKPLVLLIGFGSILSCHKDAGIPPPKGWDWFGTHDAAVYNYVLISGNQVTDKSDSNDFQIAVSAAFIDSNNNKLQGVSDLLVNARIISPSNDKTYIFGYEHTPYFQEGLSFFGNDVSIRIKGFGDNDTVSQSLYVPKRIVKLIADFPDQVNYSQDLLLRWDTDSRNHWGNVIIQVVYFPVLSKASDSTLPAEIKALSYTVPDSGSFSISSNDLIRFPPGSFIGISIARGSQSVAVLPQSKRRVFFFSSSSASTPALKVSNSKEP
jgi:hypothetical protein